MTCDNKVDTLEIFENNTFYHSYTNPKSNFHYIRNGEWKETVDGYFEMLNYSDALLQNSWDMHPYKCNKSGAIYIDILLDQRCKYEKVR